MGECAAMAATTAACIHVLKISVAGLHIPVLKKKIRVATPYNSMGICYKAPNEL